MRAIKGHTAREDGRFIRYTVYNNKTDMPVLIDGTAPECAKAMGVTLNSFYIYVHLASKGTPRKMWYIERRFLDEEEE